MVSEGDLLLLMFHQGGGRARLYVCAGRSGQRRFAGPEAAERLLAAWSPGCYPLSGLVAAGIPAGPCASYPGDDTWTDTPFATGSSWLATPQDITIRSSARGYRSPCATLGLFGT